MTTQHNLFFDANDTPSSQALKEAGAIQPDATGADATGDATIIAQVHAIVRAIPEGRVMSYGSVGARCKPPISGYICGRIMNNNVSHLPWWRVIAKDGSLPIGKRNPDLAREQRKKLEAEGVTFNEAGCVLAEWFVQSE
ncbi:MAG: MGMT family protein [Abitibacteriaceae bacterium]|nr:MGMT family protein [Abditibacteriaceae bacterium]MBV9865414.1 MGMT family protein [Abditibacteriaceae bacterium]